MNDNLPEIGAIIHRPEDDFEFEETEKGSLMLKAFRTSVYGAGDKWTATSPDRKGVVCFCHHIVPENWSCFKVKGHSSKGNCVFVKPIDESQL